MVLVFLQQVVDKQSKILESAAGLAVKFKKQLAVCSFVDNDADIKQKEQGLQTLASDLDAVIIVRKAELACLGELCEEIEASFLLLQLNENKGKSIQRLLNACRTLRIPYILYKNTFAKIEPKKVLVPVGFLEEEIEKAQFASAFGRFFGSEILLLPANDYGSKAAQTTEKMVSLFDKFSLNYTIQKAKADSFKVDKESVQIAVNEHYDIVLISASRDYGLDDMFFGPKEQHLVKQSSLPVLLVNPRGDLYALCD